MGKQRTAPSLQLLNGVWAAHLLEDDVVVGVDASVAFGRVPGDDDALVILGGRGQLGHLCVCVCVGGLFHTSAGCNLAAAGACPPQRPAAREGDAP